MALAARQSGSGLFLHTSLPEIAHAIVLPVRLRIVGNDEKAAGLYRVPEAEAFQRFGHIANDIVERVANFAVRQFSLISLVLNRDVIDARGTIPLRQYFLVRQRYRLAQLSFRRRLSARLRRSSGLSRPRACRPTLGAGVRPSTDFLICSHLVGQFGGMNLFYGKLPRKRAAGSLLYVGCYERLLHLELLLRQFKDAVLVNLIPDLTEEVGDFARGLCRPCGGRLGLLRQTIPRRQQ